MFGASCDGFVLFLKLSDVQRVRRLRFGRRVFNFVLFAVSVLRALLLAFCPSGVVVVDLCAAHRSASRAMCAMLYVLRGSASSTSPSRGNQG